MWPCRLGLLYKVNTYGKPFSVTYKYAENILEQTAQKLYENEKTSISTIYGIGDNPAADIRGANNAGGRWKSVLTRTGVSSTFRAIFFSSWCPLRDKWWN